VAQLERVLRRARQQGTHLVYWPAHPRQSVPPALLHEYGGLLADEKVTYESRDFQELEPSESAVSPRWTIRPFLRGPAPPALVQLALAAGVWSRFRVDQHVPVEKFAGLYTAWMERSTRHELADAVLVAVRTDDPGPPVGMVTLAHADSTGHVGLIAVAEAERGRGLGLALLRAGRRWMRAQGAARARVVTQQANRPACALYERAGYRVLRVEHVYHFWPQRGVCR
jgi:dTDP-4-amino-4,6-dideoxy-D-galactose acyltransferase